MEYHELPLTLAERCFMVQQAEDELFTILNEIMESKPMDQWTQPGYQFNVLSCYVDDYDGSVEVILHPEAPEFTREKADKILALGFCEAYISRSGEGLVWTKTSVGKCSPREGSESQRMIIKLKQEIKKLRS